MRENKYIYRFVSVDSVRLEKILVEFLRVITMTSYRIAIKFVTGYFEIIYRDSLSKESKEDCFDRWSFKNLIHEHHFFHFLCVECTSISRGKDKFYAIPS